MAGPRDLVDMHGLALKIKTREVTPQKMGAYVEEGRFLILELMGYLAAFYRNYVLNGGRIAPPEKTAADKMDQT
jgi:hypothetical protein